MRFAALVLSSLVLVAGCATQPQPTASASSPSSCELSAVPAGAVLGVRHGVDTATYPSQIPSDLTGCQRVWFGDRAHPEAMKILATYYFDKGHVRRLVGQVPEGQTYDCRYREGVLETAASQNSGLCPDAAQIERRN